MENAREGNPVDFSTYPGWKYLNRALLNHGMKKISLKSKTFVDTGFYDRPI